MASAGSYKCQATKNGKTDEADFTVDVEVYAARSIVNCRRGKACKIEFKVTTTDGSVSFVVDLKGISLNLSQ